MLPIPTEHPFDTKCRNCGETWDRHSGYACPTGGTRFAIGVLTLDRGSACCGVPVQCLEPSTECVTREMHHADRGLYHPLADASDSGWVDPPGPANVGMGALGVQVGGRHYKDLKIQPVEYIHANGIPFIEGSVIKYVTRWREKGGVKDLEKARHFIDLLIELENAQTKA